VEDKGLAYWSTKLLGDHTIWSHIQWSTCQDFG
jgi:hypothetical protein